MNQTVYLTHAAVRRQLNGSTELKDRNTDRLSVLCIETIADLFAADLPCTNVPLFFGSAFSSLKSLHEFNAVCEQNGPNTVSPGKFPNAVLNAPSCRAGIHHGITKPIYNLSSGTASGLDALELAMMHIRSRECEHALVCIAEEPSPLAERMGQKPDFVCAAVYLSAQPAAASIDMMHTGPAYGTAVTVPGQSTDVAIDIFKALESGEDLVQFWYDCEDRLTGLTIKTTGRGK